MERAFLPLARGPRGEHPRQPCSIPLTHPELLTPAEMARPTASPSPRERRASCSWSGRASRSPTKRRGSQSRAGGSPSSAARAATAATASSPRGCLARRGYAVELGLIGRREALRGDPALAALRYKAPSATPGRRSGGADCVIDALFGAGLARDIDGERESDHRADQCLRPRRRAGARGRRALRRGRRDRQGSRRRGRGVRERHLFPPQARPSAAARAVALRRDPAGRHRHSRGGARAHRARKPSSTRRACGARRCRAPTPKATNMPAARRSFSPARRIGPARPGSRPARRCASGAGIVTLASPPDAVADNAAHLTAVMVAPFARPPRIRGAARRRAAARDRARARRRRRAGVAQARRRGADQAGGAADDRARRRRADRALPARRPGSRR